MKIKLRRGLKATLPTLDVGEPAFVTNEKKLYIGTSSGNISLHKEAMLEWGGQNLSATFSPVDAAIAPHLGANRLAFIDGNKITAEYSRDGGATWIDYGTNSVQKASVFSMPYGGTAHIIGKADSTNIANSNYKLRFTLDFSSGSVYTVLNKFIMYVGTNGSSGCTCTIDAALQATPTTFVTIANKVSISGWSGFNVINIGGLTTYSGGEANASSQYGRLRFLFEITGHNASYTGLSVLSISAHGGVGWTTPSTLARTGNIYTYDASQNVTFPAKVTCTIIDADYDCGTF
jgi:hypothetical protein